MAADAVSADKPSAPVKRVHNIVWNAGTLEELIGRWVDGPARILEVDSYNISDSVCGACKQRRATHNRFKERCYTVTHKPDATTIIITPTGQPFHETRTNSTKDARGRFSAPQQLSRPECEVASGAALKAPS
jgi:hypothetical protein